MDKLDCLVWQIFNQPIAHQQLNLLSFMLSISIEKKGDLRDFVGAFQKLLIYWEFSTQPIFRIYREWIK